MGRKHILVETLNNRTELRGYRHRFAWGLLLYAVQCLHNNVAKPHKVSTTTYFVTPIGVLLKAHRSMCPQGFLYAHSTKGGVAAQLCWESVNFYTNFSTTAPPNGFGVNFRLQMYYCCNG